MKQSEIESAVIATLNAQGKMEYADLLVAIPGATPERIAVATFRLRNSGVLKMRLVAQPEGKPLHTVEVV